MLLLFILVAFGSIVTIILLFLFLVHASTVWGWRWKGSRCGKCRFHPKGWEKESAKKGEACQDRTDKSDPWPFRFTKNPNGTLFSVKCTFSSNQLWMFDTRRNFTSITSSLYGASYSATSDELSCMWLFGWSKPIFPNIGYLATSFMQMCPQLHLFDSSWTCPVLLMDFFIHVTCLRIHICFHSHLKDFV